MKVVCNEVPQETDQGNVWCGRLLRCIRMYVQGAVNKDPESNRGVPTSVGRDE